MIVGITGTREGWTEQQKKTFYDIMSDKYTNISEIHHGGCDGIDMQVAWTICNHFPSIKLECHKPKQKISKFFLQRNKDIVNSCDILWAFPRNNNEEVRSGTWSTIRYARKKEIPTVIIYPNGKVVRDEE